ncbi:MAG: pyruvate dehydrogenase (acetyl-transferring) E1 component subunit alpha [Hahellaceae bacterium]|nr:pyruvate dehydrogenase (acetyl-transferring) E1 component subunit alpha [Hahellaceae bacterium]
MKQKYEFSVQSHRFINSAGKALMPLPARYADLQLLEQAYEQMVLIRTFDQKAIALQRTGKIGTYPSVLGHEAINIGAGLALHQEDVFAPYYRDLGIQYLRGVSFVEQLMYWGGDERGSCYAKQPEDLPICVPIATQFCHAAGVASAIKFRQQARAVLVSGGDGSTSKGDFLESLNLAGAWQLPLVFLVSNNQWAISTPRYLQCHAETLAQKAIGAGIPGVQVDGNDFVAVHDTLTDALTRARTGHGPTLVEAVTYRLGDHTTADDASRYRSQEDLKKAWEEEPIKRLRLYLSSQNAWDEKREQALLQRCKVTVEKAVADYAAIEPDVPTAMFDHLFATLPEDLHDQYEELRRQTQEASHD